MKCNFNWGHHINCTYLGEICAPEWKRESVNTAQREMGVDWGRQRRQRGGEWHTGKEKLGVSRCTLAVFPLAMFFFQLTVWQLIKLLFYCPHTFHPLLCPWCQFGVSGFARGYLDDDIHSITQLNSHVAALCYTYFTGLQWPLLNIHQILYKQQIYTISLSTFWIVLLCIWKLGLSSL